MSEPTAIPYRTPACNDHLPDNESDECPWCKLEAAEATIKDIGEYVYRCRYMRVMPTVVKLKELLEKHNG
jgi:hypothetical protein